MTESYSLSTPNQANMLEHGLYLVATPIGNMRDITLRAIDVLNQADLIACEDTRVTAKLKNAYGIKAKTISYHNHNEEKATEYLLDILKNEKKIVALVSDAGTPLMSDPGYRIAKACIDNDVPIFSIPGACASIVALTLSGLPVNRFLFNGFLPSKPIARRNELKMLSIIPSTIIFYESNHRLIAVLEDMLDILGDRDAVIAREMTKHFEEITRLPISELIEHYKTKDKIKGEITIIVSPPIEKQNDLSAEEIDEILISTSNDKKLSSKEVASLVAEKTGLKKRDLYNRLQELKS